jgi:hypothetical protein
MEGFLVIFGIVLFAFLISSTRTKWKRVKREDATGTHEVTYSTEVSDVKDGIGGTIFLAVLLSFTGIGLVVAPFLIWDALTSRRKSTIQMDYRHKTADGERTIVAEVPKTKHNQHLVD